MIGTFDSVDCDIRVLQPNGSIRIHRPDNGCLICVQELNSAMRRVWIGLAGKQSPAALEAHAALGFKEAKHITPDVFISYLRTRMEGVPKFETFL